MNKLAVFYREQPVGTLAIVRGGIFFEYASSFLASGHELSPLALPLGPGVRSRDASPTMRLPGVFEDSLPDSWGTRVMDDFFRQRGVPPHAVDPLMRLSFIGRRAFGGLIYAPASGVDAPRGTLDTIYAAAAQMEEGARTDLALLADVGTSPGGARPKAALWFDPAMQSIAHDFDGDHPDAWLVKFDTSAGRNLGRLEYAYALLAGAAGIRVPEVRLLETPYAGGARAHFAVRRFDRHGAERVHYHSLAGLCQMLGSDLDYQILLRVTRRITRDHAEVLQAFRRAVFNVLASNRDDHGKNHGFVYDGSEWRLSPAFDMTFVGSGQLRERGMAVMGERSHAGLPQLEALANTENIDRRDRHTIIDGVRAALVRWPEFADRAGLCARDAKEIEDVLIALDRR
jgi:serine/threonine-protein kinase HipA